MGRLCQDGHFLTANNGGGLITNTVKSIATKIEGFETFKLIRPAFYSYAIQTLRGYGSNSILSNISTRSFVQTGDNVMIGGLIVQGTQPKRIIIRAVGPELTQYGVANVLANPTLEVHDSTGALIAFNDNWQNTIIGGIITSDQRLDILQSGHAPGNPLESAIIADLPAGNYTAIVRGVSNMTGVELVEVYDLD
jgi:hypothetical protein